MDLSRNGITLNTEKSQNIFFSALNGLRNLTIFSLAFNSFQDHNFETLVNSIEHILVDIKVLDLEKTFITGKSVPKIIHLVNLKDPKQIQSLKDENMFNISLTLDNLKDTTTFRREISIIGSLFTLDQRAEIESKCKKSVVELRLDGPSIYLEEYSNYNAIVSGSVLSK